MSDKRPWKPGEGQPIAELFAWVATEPDGGEGVCSAQIGGIHLPLVGADKERIESLREYAVFARQATGYPVRLVRFSAREEIETLP